MKLWKISHCAQISGSSTPSIFFWLGAYVSRVLVILFAVLVSFIAQAEPVSDVRVLIDVSGSMKKNDPNNLRSPAVKLLVGLIPENTKSGIWTFGRYINMQVKLGKVDKSWKQKAMLEANKIHSRGLFTNIEEAVKQATVDWQNPDPRYDRHLILLTDGVVDISKDARLNEQSRRRLLHEILPKLEAADATVHAIALSKNTDEELLNALAGATKGSFVQVDKAEELQRVFFKIFEKSVKPDTLPIEENKFTVDKHVSDITVLIFLAKDSPATSLTLPDGKVWSEKKHPKIVKWHHDTGYDLITVKGPIAGEWTLLAMIDPDNRVMIVTNLKLKVDNLPNSIMLGDKFVVRARLLEEGKIVTNKNLLTRTAFAMKRIDDQDHVKNITLLDNGSNPDVIKSDGVYSASFDSLKKAGDYELAIRAKSLTFKRAIRHSLRVHDSPANIRISQAAKDKPYVIKIIPHVGLIRPDSISMQVSLPDNSTIPVKQVDDLVWSVTIPNKYSGKKFKLTLAGSRYSDEPVKMDFEQILTVTAKSQSLALKIKAKKIDKPDTTKENKSKDDHAIKAADAENTEIVAENDEGKEFNWVIVIGLVIGVNGLVIGGGWFGYRKWKQRQTQEQDAVAKELEK